MCKMALDLIVTLVCWTLFLVKTVNVLCVVLAGFPAIPCFPCFLCCRCCSAVTRAGWPGWSMSAQVPCALQQPLLQCSSQRPSSSTLSGASSSPVIWRKEHDLLLVQFLYLLALKGCVFSIRSVWKKGFHVCLEALMREWQCWLATWILFCLLNWSVQQKRGE